MTAHWLPADVMVSEDAPLIGGLDPVYEMGSTTPVDFVPAIDGFPRKVGFVMSEAAYKLKLEHAQQEALAHARTQGHLREMKKVIREQNQRIEQLQAAKKPPAVPLSDKLLEDLRLGEISFQEFDDRFPAALAEEEKHPSRGLPLDGSPFEAHPVDAGWLVSRGRGSGAISFYLIVSLLLLLLLATQLPQ